MRALLIRLALVVPVVALVHAFGFAYAHLAAPLQAARSPLFATGPEQEPLLVAYGRYLSSALSADFGLMPVTEQPLLRAIATAAVNSLGLLALALALSLAIGLPLGRAAARRNPARVGTWLTLTSGFGLALPGVFIGSLLITAILVYGPQRTGLIRPPPLQGFGWDAHLILPTLVLMVRPTLLIAQVTAGLLAGELDKPYVAAAVARGVPWRRIVRHHAFMPVIAPVTQTVAGTLRLMVAELVVVERMFDWPGLGRMLASTFIPSQVSTSPEAPLFLYPPVVAAALAALALIFMFTDTVAAATARAADPRLRA